MKQLGLSLNMYAQDYDGTLMQTTYEHPTLKIHWSSSCSLRKEPADFRLPVRFQPCNARHSLYLQHGSGVDCDAQVPKFSYINNYNAIPAHDWLPASEAAFEKPASLIVLAERRNTLTTGAVIASGKAPAVWWPPATHTVQAREADRYAWRHVPLCDQARCGCGPSDDERQNAGDYSCEVGSPQRGANYSFFDGHAKWARLEQTINPNDFLWDPTGIRRHS